MIKINLALRKAATAGGSSAQPAVGSALASVDFSSLPVGSIVISLLLYFGPGLWIDHQKETLLQELETEKSSFASKRTELQASLSKTKQYDDLKKALEADQKLISTKLETILKLTGSRGVDLRSVQMVSHAIPDDIWLSELRFTSAEMTFKGKALDFNLVSDFMKKLGESELLADVQMENTSQDREEKGGSVATFEIKAKLK